MVSDLELLYPCPKEERAVNPGSIGGWVFVCLFVHDRPIGFGSLASSVKGLKKKRKRIFSHKP